MSSTKSITGCVGIFGVGLIGGSLGIDLRRMGIVDRVIGIGRNPGRLKLAVERGAVDDFTTDLSEVLRQLDVLVLGTPLGTYEPILRSAADGFREGTIVTDVGSAKEVSIRLMEDVLPGRVRPVGAHPMAGREKTGIENAEAGLFQGAVCAVCPTQRTDGDALETVKRLWTAVGARVLPIGAGLHDRIVARTSHLPHLVAAVLTGTAGKILAGEELALEFIASGFFDTTRIAAGDPVMWRDICRDNRREILSSISEFKEQLERIEEWVREGKTEEISRELARIQRIRQEIGNNRKP